MKQSWFKTSIGRFRAISIIEGISFLVLLFIAMPLKYFADLPLAVKIVGWAHGVLFIGYLIALAQVTIIHRWFFMRVISAFIASLIPFGPFILERQLSREEKAAYENTKAIVK